MERSWGKMKVKNLPEEGVPVFAFTGIRWRIMYWRNGLWYEYPGGSLYGSLQMVQRWHEYEEGKEHEVEVTKDGA